MSASSWVASAGYRPPREQPFHQLYVALVDLVLGHKGDRGRLVVGALAQANACLLAISLSMSAAERRRYDWMTTPTSG